MRRTFAGLFAGLAVLIAVPGCGDDSMADVAGTVTLDGNPVKDGAITFIPVDGQTQTAGSVIKDGRYTAKVPLGEMKVTISAPKVVGKKKIYDTPNSPEMPITKEAAPDKYNTKTELRYTVVKGANQKNFELSSK